MKKPKHNQLGLVVLADQDYEKLCGVEPLDGTLPRRQVIKIRLDKPQEIPDPPDYEIEALPLGGLEKYFRDICQRVFTDEERQELNNLVVMSVELETKLTDEVITNLIVFAEKNVGKWCRLNLADQFLSVEDEILEKVIIFDTETFYLKDNLPVVGQALSCEAVYLWLHPCYADDEYVGQTLSIGEGKIIIAHNAAFDYARIDERFSLETYSSVRALCTLSMMRLVAGLDDSLRWCAAIASGENLYADYIKQIGCEMNLVSCYNFATGRSLGKEGKKLRDVFTKSKTVGELRSMMFESVSYALKDLALTVRVFGFAYPRWLKMIGHQGVEAGQVIVADSVIPLASDWEEWITKCQDTYNLTLMEIVADVYDGFELLAERYRDDERLASLDWGVSRPPGWRKKYYPKAWEEKYGNKPNWWNKFSRGELSVFCHDFTRLMLFEFYDKEYEEWFPLKMVTGIGWHYSCPSGDRRVPHRTGVRDTSVGSLLTKDSIRFVDREYPILRSEILEKEELLTLLKRFDKLTTWKGFSNRVRAVIYRTLPHCGGVQHCAAGDVVPCGTITGRTVSPLWNTLPSHFDDDNAKIGSEIKSKIQAPPGYSLVYFDCDSQELSVMATLADSYLYVSGSSPMGKLVLSGDKKKGTDLHSEAARRAGVPRNPTGKNLVYGCCYGSGLKTATETVYKGSTESLDVCRSKAFDFQNGFKGRKTPEGYVGGIASEAFNKMISIVREHQGLFFNNDFPRCLWAEYNKHSLEKPNQINFTIQSSCSTYGFLSLLVAGIKYECLDRRCPARFCVPVHDEMLWLVKEGHELNFARIVQLVHARVWALLHQRLGLEDIPFSRVFLSGIAVDKIYRKDCSKPVITPTYRYEKITKEISIYDL